MNYLNIYNKIITKAKQLNRTKQENVYYELHHILPKSLGGDNSSINLVRLTAKEHYICHHLLFRHYTKSSEILPKGKMATAFMLMSRGRNKEFIKPLTAIEYQKAREAMSIYYSLTRKGSNNPMFGQQNKRKGKTGFSTENIRAAGVRKRKYTKKYHWVNRKTKKEIIATAQDFHKKFKLPNNHILEIIRPECQRLTCNDWYIKGTNIKNKKCRDKDNLPYSFINLNKLYCFTGTVPELLLHDLTLSRSKVLHLIKSVNIGNRSNALKGDWILQEKFERISKLDSTVGEIHKFKNTETGIIEYLPIYFLARKYNLRVEHIKQMVKTTRKTKGVKKWIKM